MWLYKQSHQVLNFNFWNKFWQMKFTFIWYIFKLIFRSSHSVLHSSWVTLIPNINVWPTTKFCKFSAIFVMFAFSFFIYFNGRDKNFIFLTFCSMKHSSRVMIQWYPPMFLWLLLLNTWKFVHDGFLWQIY